MKFRFYKISILPILILLSTALFAQENGYEQKYRLYNFPIDYVYAVKQDNKWGVVDSSGNLIVPVVYDEIWANTFKIDSLSGEFFHIDKKIVPIIKERIISKSVYGKYTHAPAGYCLPEVNIFCWDKTKEPLGRFASICTSLSTDFIIIIGATPNGIWSIEATSSPSYISDSIDDFDNAISIELVLTDKQGKRNSYQLVNSYYKSSDKVLYKIWELVENKILNIDQIKSVKCIFSPNEVNGIRHAGHAVPVSIINNEKYPGWIVSVEDLETGFHFKYDLVSVNPTTAGCYYKWNCIVSKVR